MPFLRLEQEIWIFQFSSKLMELQPRVPPRIADEIAAKFWPQLSILSPADAVQSTLELALDHCHDNDFGLPSDSAYCSAASAGSSDESTMNR